MRRYELTLFADYHQFYIQDEKADGDLSEAWTDAAVERLLAVGPGTVGLGTVRNVDVPVTISVLEQEPVLDADKFDHIVECSIAVESGTTSRQAARIIFPMQRASPYPRVRIVFVPALKVLTPCQAMGLRAMTITTCSFGLPQWVRSRYSSNVFDAMILKPP
jgi:hypothetical protein